MKGSLQGRGRMVHSQVLSAQRPPHAIISHQAAATPKPRKDRVVARADSDEGSRQPWDFGRFVQTALFFANPLTAAKNLVGNLTKPLARDANPSLVSAYKTMSGTAAEAGRPAVLVLGATGGTGARVVRRLLAKGERVRALVRDARKAEKVLGALPVATGGVLEVAAADLSQPATVVPELFEDVRSAISCSGAVVQPKEGDEDRSKYLQGIKFYEPELAKDTPDSVERDGIQAVLQRIAPQLGMKDGLPILDMSGVESRWGALDDVVMGGVSQSGLYRVRGAGPAKQDVAVLRGNISVANNGGFASVRSKNWQPPLDLGAYEGLRVTLRGDGQRYKFILRCSEGWDSICYCLSFDTPKDEWATLDLPFSDFKPVFRAKVKPSEPPLDPAHISSVQFMLSKFEYDGALNPHFTPGIFELPIAELCAYLPHGAPPRFVHISSAGVTRPNRPGINIEEEPPAVRMNDMLGGLLTYKLVGEDLVRWSGVPFAIVRPCALTEEPFGMPLVFDQGDSIRGKISREDVADLCVSLLSCGVAANTTFEVSSTVPFAEPWTGRDATGEEWPQGSTEEQRSRDWAKELADAGLKRGVTGKTINGVYTGKEVEADAATKKPEVAAA